MTRGLALALSMLTGFSGLVYEVYWEKYLATLLGSHCEATAAVLGIFLIPQLGLVTVRMFMGRINLSAGVALGSSVCAETPSRSSTRGTRRLLGRWFCDLRGRGPARALDASRLGMNRHRHRHC